MKVDLTTSAILHAVVIAFGLLTVSETTAVSAPASGPLPIVILMVVPSPAEGLNSQTPPITVSIKEGGQVYLQEAEVPIDELVAKLGTIAKAGYEERILMRGDKTADYGTVMNVMARIRAAGYTQIGLVTLQEQDK
jgi:biopolymer transport protein ExbD